MSCCCLPSPALAPKNVWLFLSITPVMNGAVTKAEIRD